jgi:hypothetical protein
MGENKEESQKPEQGQNVGSGGAKVEQERKGGSTSGVGGQGVSSWPPPRKDRWEEKEPKGEGDKQRNEDSFR